MATKQTAPAKRNEALIEYLAALPTRAAKEDFAKRCRTSLPFLKQVAHGHKPAGESLAIDVDRETRGFVTCESLRSTTWTFAYLRGTAKKRVGRCSGTGARR
jgi:DNA-binding transcriptional regulator YdaS (Cro superfamily)